MKYIFLLLLLFIVGCTRLPVVSFVPYTTKDGNSAWHLGARGMSQYQIETAISEGVGQHKICPNGWEITDIKPSGEGLTIYEGKCK